MIRRSLAVLIALLSLAGFGQDRVVEIDWTGTDSILYFPGATYHASAPGIPVYAAVLPWKTDGKIPEVAFAVNHAVPVKERYHGQFAAAAFHETPEWTFSLARENRVPRLLISVTPFFNDPSTGKLMQVTSFSLKISSQQPLAPLRSEQQGQYTQASVLSEGDWYRIGVTRTGMHALTYEKLLEIGISNPAMTRIFGAGAIRLPEDYSQGAYDDLSAVPVYLDKGADGLFGPGDRMLFFARGPVEWTYDPAKDFFSQELHPYSNTGYYFLTEDRGAPEPPPDISSNSDTPDQVVTTYDIVEYYEEENFNLLGSGREWYGDNYNLNLSGAYPFTLDGLVTGDDVRIRVEAAGRSGAESSVRVKANNSTLGNVSFSPVNMSSYTATYAIRNSNTFSYRSQQEVITVQVEYLQPDANSEAWLDGITLNGRAALRMSGDQLIFRDSRSVGTGAVSEFRLTNISGSTVIWEITDPGNPRNVPFTRSGNQATFRTTTGTLREFIAFEPGAVFPEPVTEGDGTGKIANQNLHGTAPPDMLIIHPDAFREQAGRLADHRRTRDGLTVNLVTQEMIFNEFSSGTPDVSAIRNFLKMYYDSYTDSEMTDYLLLFGDGSFDNRDTASTNPNLLMTYQSHNSLSPVSSYVSDDFFGLLDTGEKLYDGLLDIGIGRLPVSTTEEAEMLVDKIISYDDLQTIGEWRNYICFIGDDEDGNIHMRQANSLAEYLEEHYPQYNINKILLDAYPQETTPTGDLYPDVTRAINNQMNRGALIINYTGHGGVNGLAHEKILSVNDIKSWNNEGRYPLFMTATCEFSRYDAYKASEKKEVSSAGEDVLLNPSGGSIALFTTTRLVYSGPNHTLNEKFYETVFEKQEDGDYYRLGDIIKYSKNETGAGINKRNFTLLGDPALRLSFPKNQVITDSIDHQPVGSYNDTISALDFVTISGHIASQSGTLLQDFNGSVIPIVFDKKTNLKTLANDGGTPYDFSTRNSILYKGNATVQNGRFTFSFYVPKDIGYNFGEGKVSYYGYSETTDAHGSNAGLTIGGLGNFTGMDTLGPDIRVFMNDSLFRNGGIVDRSPELLIYMDDPYGINTTGNGIGHDITATLNGDRFNAVILNEYYQADPDSFSSGTVRYPYSDLPEGNHTISVKVWDIFNNSATESLDFIVVDSEEMLLEEIFNYPNPFTDRTFFNIEHNRPGEDMEVVIRIYDLRGTLVSVLQQQLYSGGYRIDPPQWEGKTMGGATLGGGLYVYRVLVRTTEGEEAVGSGRMIIRR